MYDLDSLKFEAVNDAAVDRYGYSREQFLGMTWDDIRRRDAVAAPSQQITPQSMATHFWSAATEQHEARDGSIIEVEMDACRFDWNGQRLALALARDAAERTSTEQALRLSETRYRELFENAIDAIFTTDLDLNFTALNRAAEVLLGYGREEAKALNFAALITSEALKVVQRNLDEQRAGSPASAYETEILARGGRRVPIEITTRLVSREGVAVAIEAIARDISDRKRLEQGLRQAQKMEAIGRLAGGVAHDFNNLLTVILGYSEDLVLRLAPDDPSRDAAVEIKNAANSAADLTRQLLAFSRRQLVRPIVLNLNTIVARLAPMLRRVVGKDMSLHIRVDSDVCAVKADPGQMEQVIMNLVVNARDAMPQGGDVIIETKHTVIDPGDTLERPWLAPGQYVVLVVEDTGHGMDADTKTHLFEPFFTTKDVGKGTGLGLSTVYGIVKQSSGYILVDSEPGQGSRFRVYFPDRGADEIDAEPESTAVHGSWLGTESVLLVDDDRGVREFAVRALATRGYEVAAASSGDEVQRLCEHRSHLDLLVTDIVMPGMDGRSLAGVLSARYPGMRVLYMSGYTSDPIVSSLILDPSRAFIPKPFTAQSLAEKVRETLDRPHTGTRK